MWENGFCEKQDSPCFQKRPPIEKVNGRDVENPQNLPPDQWPEPSPIRFAFMEDKQQKLQQAEILATINNADTTKLLGEDRMVFVRSMLANVVDKPRPLQSEVIQKLKEKFNITKKDLDLILKDIMKQDFKEKQEEMLNDKTVKTLKLDKETIIQKDGKYYRLIQHKEDVEEVPISNFIFNIEKCIDYLDFDNNGKALPSIICHIEGKITTEKGTTYNVVFNNNDTCSAQRFIKSLQYQTKYKANIADVGSNIKHVISAAMEFSIFDTEIISRTFGWQGNTYRTPSLVIDKTGIHENINYKVELQSQKKGIEKFDFSSLDVNELPTILRSFFDDLLNLHEHKSTYYMAAVSFLAPIINMVGGNNNKFCLWYYGVPSSGKTFLVRNFWNLFMKEPADGDEISWVGSTQKGTIKDVSIYKDAVAFVDDYKRSDMYKNKIAVEFLHMAYNQQSPSALMRSGEHTRNPYYIRGMVVCTGEDYPKDTGAISRAILVYVPKEAKYKNYDAATRIYESRVKYNGIMPYYINWFLNKDIGNVNQIIEAKKQQIRKQFEEQGQIDRITMSCSWLYFGFKTLMDFLFDFKVITQEEYNKKIEEMDLLLLDTTKDMVNYTTDTSVISRFTDILGALITTNAVVVKNYNDSEEKNPHHSNKPVVGVVKVNEAKQTKDPYIYISPDIAIAEVMKIVNRNEGSTAIMDKENLFMLLKGQNLIFDLKNPKDKGTRLNAKHGLGRGWMWAFNRSDLGIDMGIYVIENTEQLKLAANSEAVPF